MRAHDFFKENSARLKLPKHKRMGRVLQLVWAAEVPRDTFAESDLKTRNKTRLGRGWSTQKRKVTHVLLRQESEYTQGDGHALLSFPRQSAASFLKAESRFLDIRRIIPVLEPDQAQKPSSAFAKIPDGCRCQLLRPGSFFREKSSLLCECCIPDKTLLSSKEP